jgi:hypothetical protein
MNWIRSVWTAWMNERDLRKQNRKLRRIYF